MENVCCMYGKDYCRTLLTCPRQIFIFSGQCKCSLAGTNFKTFNYAEKRLAYFHNFKSRPFRKNDTFVITYTNILSNAMTVTVISKRKVQHLRRQWTKDEAASHMECPFVISARNAKHL